MEKVRHKLRAVHEAVSRGDTRPYLATQDLLNALHALLGGLTPAGAGKGVPLSDRICAIAEAIHGVAMSLANEAKAEEAKKQQVGECEGHLSQQELGQLSELVDKVRAEYGESVLLDRVELLGAVLGKKVNPYGKLLFLLKVIEMEMGALAGARALLRRHATALDGMTFSDNCRIERGKPRQCRMCGGAGASDLDIVHSKTCKYAAMRTFIGFPVLQAVE